MKKMLMTSIVGAALLLAFAPAAISQEYPPDDPFVAVSDTLVGPGDPVTAVAGGLDPGSTANWTFESDPVFLGTTRADAEGRTSITFRVPTSATPGIHHVVASGTDPDGDPIRVSSALRVVGTSTGQPTPADPGSPGTPGQGGTPGAPGDAGTPDAAGGADEIAASADGNLPRTGSDILNLVGTGLALVAAGAGIVFLARKRLSARSA